MGEALVRASFSTNIKERRDCSTALLDAKGEVLCQAEHIPMHLGSFIGFLSQLSRRHDASGLAAGDVFIANDPYEGGGTHLPDIVLCEPIFLDGAILAWAINTAHHADFADRGHAHIFQEGIRIPPVRLYRAGALEKDALDLILSNCQVPRERLSDLRAQRAANRLGVERMRSLCGKYGKARVLAVGEALLDYAERKMRAGIGALPDGVYRFADSFDNPELGRCLEFSVEISLAGEEMRLHFESPPQLSGGLNMTYGALLASVYYAVKAVIDPTTLPNAGLARPLTVTARKGTVLNCAPPAAVNGRTSTSQRVADLVFGALAKAVPERVVAAGNGSCTTASFAGQRSQDGRIWVYLETIGGGSGARAGKDGLDGVHVHMTNTSNLPVEALEVEYPLTVLRYELVEGSGGAGRFRGGMGLRRVYRAEAPCRLRLDGARLLSAPWGLEGGLPGGRGAFRFSARVEPFSKGEGHLEAGEEVEIITPGAGGYGPPTERERALVSRDLEDGILDEECARLLYGVVPARRG
jgi:N-methylhydantoinase B